MLILLDTYRLEKLGRLVEGTEYCAACFNGEYPTNIPKDLRKDRFEGKLSGKKSVPGRERNSLHSEQG